MSRGTNLRVVREALGITIEDATRITCRPIASLEGGEVVLSSTALANITSKLVTHAASGSTRPNPITSHDLDTMDAEDIVLLVDDGTTIVILNEEADRAEHILTPQRAIAWAERLLTLVRIASSPTATRADVWIRRPRTVDEQLMERDV